MFSRELGRPHEAIMEARPAGEHHPNGVMECVVQMVGGMLRAHKLAPEQKFTDASYKQITWFPFG